MSLHVLSILADFFLGLLLGYLLATLAESFLHRNVQHAGSTTIQFFNNNNLLDTLVVPASPTPGQAVFAGELFANPIVTNVTLILGTDTLFTFNGSTTTGTTTNSPPTHNLVVTDDFVYPEPVSILDANPVLPGPTGTLNAQAKASALPRLNRPSELPNL